MKPVIQAITTAGLAAGLYISTLVGWHSELENTAKYRSRLAEQRKNRILKDSDEHEGSRQEKLESVLENVRGKVNSEGSLSLDDYFSLIHNSMAAEGLTAVYDPAQVSSISAILENLKDDPIVIFRGLDGCYAASSQKNIHPDHMSDINQYRALRNVVAVAGIDSPEEVGYFLSTKEITIRNLSKHEIEALAFDLSSKRASDE